MTRCELHCPVCREPFDWLRGYGREIRCCGKPCHDEAEWRRTLAILGEAYRPLVTTRRTQDEPNGLSDLLLIDRFPDEIACHFEFNGQNHKYIKRDNELIATIGFEPGTVLLIENKQYRARQTVSDKTCVRMQIEESTSH